MNKFTFDKKEQKLLTVEIEGKVFRFNPHTLVVKMASEKFVKCQEPLINKMKKKNLSKKELDDVVIRSCSLVRETVNNILGKGAYEKIFKNRTVDFYDHQNLITFLFNEILAFSNNEDSKNNESVTR